MTKAEAQRKRKGLGSRPNIGRFTLLVVGGAMVFLVVMLTKGCGDGRKAIEAYVAAIKGGAKVSDAVAGDEADAVTNALRASESLSVGDFQSQAGTGCFFVTLHGSGKSVDARFVLAERASTTEVTRVSLVRKCECPDDGPCHMR